jgi:hypothetical protein
MSKLPVDQLRTILQRHFNDRVLATLIDKSPVDTCPDIKVYSEESNDVLVLSQPSSDQPGQDFLLLSRSQARELWPILRLWVGP